MNLYAANRLQTLCLEDFSQVAEFYGRDPRLASLLQSPPAPRARPLAKADLEELARFNTLAFSDAKKVRARVDRLADPRCLVVLTGQQSGLLLGPLYATLKAINAVQIARRLEEATGRPAQALFWIASEDHDFDEVRGVSWVDRDGRRHAFDLELPAGCNGWSVGTIPLDRDALFRLLARFAKGLPENPELLTQLGDLVNDSATLGDLFRNLLLWLFQGAGLLAVDPWFSPIKRHLPGILRREIENPGASTADVLAVSERLSQAGFASQVHRREGDVNFFLYADKVRAKVIHEGGRFRAVHPQTGETLSDHDAGSLLALLEESPELFSPNVLTKPLVRDLVFRPVAYVAGPGELAYYAQMKTLYDQAAVEMPAILPRSQVVLINPKVRRALGHLGLSAEEWLAMSEAERGSHLARRGIGAEFLEEFETQSAEMMSQIDALEKLVVRLDPGLRRSAERLRGSMTTALDKLAVQMTHSAQRRDADLGEAEERTREALLPGGVHQERRDNIVAPHLWREGPGLIDRLFEALDPGDPNLRVVETR
jgi:bacillithiol biosynthesis cysteine-adding enzyme BshC